MSKIGPKEQALRDERESRASRKAPRPPGPVRGKAEFDRRPMAVADFIAAAGAAGRKMIDLEQHFRTDAPGLRSKISLARREHGIKIEFEGGVYRIKAAV